MQVFGKARRLKSISEELWDKTFEINLERHVVGLSRSGSVDEATEVRADRDCEFHGGTTRRSECFKLRCIERRADFFHEVAVDGARAFWHQRQLCCARMGAN